MSNRITAIVLKTISILSASGLVIASMGFGSVYAYQSGSMHSELLGGLTVLMALGLEGLKPLAIHIAIKDLFSPRFIRGVLLLTLGLVAIAYSLTAELSLMSMNKGDMVAGRQALIDASKKAQAAYDRATTELSSLPPSRPVGVVEAKIKAIEDLPLITINGKVCGGTYDGEVTKRNCPILIDLKSELAVSIRHQELLKILNDQDTITKASSATAKHVQLADPSGTALSTYLAALGFSTPVDVISQWLNLIPVLAIEIGSALAVVLVSSFDTGGSGSEAGSGGGSIPRVSGFTCIIKNKSSNTQGC